jgi:hypothetical protein
MCFDRFNAFLKNLSSLRRCVAFFSAFLMLYGCVSEPNKICENVSCDSLKNVESEAEIGEGVFLDSAVSGVTFYSGDLVGVTDREGRFQYVDGESVSFYLGSLFLGESPGGEIVTPVDLAENDFVKSIHLARLLQSLDADLDPENGISIEVDTTDYFGEHFRGSGFEEILQNPEVQRMLSKKHSGRALDEIIPSYGKAAAHLLQSLSEKNIEISDSIAELADKNSSVEIEFHVPDVVYSNGDSIPFELSVTSPQIPLTAWCVKPGLVQPEADDLCWTDLVEYPSSLSLADNASFSVLNLDETHISFWVKNAVGSHFFSAEPLRYYLLREAKGIPKETSVNSPVYMFTSDLSGAVAFSEECPRRKRSPKNIESDVVTAVKFDNLTAGVYSGCQIFVEVDEDLRIGPLLISNFVILEKTIIGGEAGVGDSEGLEGSDISGDGSGDSADEDSGVLGDAPVTDDPEVSGEADSSGEGGSSGDSEGLEGSDISGDGSGDSADEDSGVLGDAPVTDDPEVSGEGGSSGDSEGLEGSDISGDGSGDSADEDSGILGDAPVTDDPEVSGEADSSGEGGSSDDSEGLEGSGISGDGSGDSADEDSEILGDAPVTDDPEVSGEADSSGEGGSSGDSEGSEDGGADDTIEIEDDGLIIVTAPPTITAFEVLNGWDASSSRAVELLLEGYDDQAVSQYCVKLEETDPAVNDPCWKSLGNYIGAISETISFNAFEGWDIGAEQKIHAWLNDDTNQVSEKKIISVEYLPPTISKFLPPPKGEASAVLVFQSYFNGMLHLSDECPGQKLNNERVYDNMSFQLSFLDLTEGVYEDCRVFVLEDNGHMSDPVLVPQFEVVLSGVTEEGTSPPSDLGFSDSETTDSGTADSGESDAALLDSILSGEKEVDLTPPVIHQFQLNHDNQSISGLLVPALVEISDDQKMGSWCIAASTKGLPESNDPCWNSILDNDTYYEVVDYPISEDSDGWVSLSLWARDGSGNLAGPITRAVQYQPYVVLQKIPEFTNNTTPEFIFQSTYDSRIEFSEGCPQTHGTFSDAFEGQETTIFFGPAPDGRYSNCKITLTHEQGFAKSIELPAFIIDTVPPVIEDLRVDYKTGEDFYFRISENAYMSLEGGCALNTNLALEGGNLYHFHEVGKFPACTVEFTDFSGNRTEVSIPEFEVPSKADFSADVSFLSFVPTIDKIYCRVDSSTRNQAFIWADFSPSSIDTISWTVDPIKKCKRRSCYTEREFEVDNPSSKMTFIRDFDYSTPTTTLSLCISDGIDQVCSSKSISGSICM